MLLPRDAVPGTPVHPSGPSVRQLLFGPEGKSVHGHSTTNSNSHKISRKVKS